jgi:hypothetical protein
MPPRRYKFRLGEKAVIIADISDASQSSKPRRGLLDYIDPEYPGRRLNPNPLWDFFDIATRLRSVDTPSDFLNGYRAIDATDSPSTDASKTLEYVEIMFDALGEFTDILQGVDVPATGEYDVYSLATNHLQMDIADEAALAAWDAVCLGLSSGDTMDPFGSTTLDADDARPIPNCMPVWYGYDDQPDDLDTYDRSSGYQNDIFDIELYNDDTTQKFPNTKTREIVEDISTTFRPSNPFFQTVWDDMEKAENPYWQSTLDDDGNYQDERKDHENWNPLNLSQNGQDISKRGHMKLTDASGSGHIRVRSRLVYEPFDTGDVDNYKVTSEPLYSADAVDFSASVTSPLKIYLKPQWQAFCRDGLYSYGRSLSYETFRGINSFPNPDEWANSQGSTWDFFYDDGSTQPFGGLQFGYTPKGGNEPDFDPNAPVFNWGSFSFDRQTGAWSVGATVVGGIGSINFSGSATYQPNSVPAFTGWWMIGPDHGFTGHDWFIQDINNSIEIGNYRLWGIWREYSPSQDPSSTITGAVIDMFVPSEQFKAFPGWGTVNTVIGSAVEIFRGCHIGRYPVFPRTLDRSGWFGPLGSSSPSTRTFEDGSTKDYDPDVAKELTGRSLFWNPFSGTHARQLYERHASRDTKEIAKRIYIYRGQWAPEFDLTGFVTVDETTATWKQVFDIGAGQATWDALFDGGASDIASSMEAETHIRNVNLGTPSSDYDEFGGIYMNPIDARAGRLCAVIVKGSTKYYIWGKTAQSRGGYDYDRNQGSMSYSGSLD